MAFLEYETKLPAIVATWDGSAFVPARNAVFAKAACDLGHRTIRVITLDDEIPDSMVRHLESGDIEELDWNREVTEDLKPGLETARHVFFFGSPPNSLQMAEFERLIRSLFGPYQDDVEALSLEVFDSGEGVAFEARTPRGNRVWGAELFRMVDGFSKSTLPVISYQGVRWERYYDR